MKKKTRKPVDTNYLIVCGFFILILIGTIILSLPISSNANIATPFLTSLFTATSATCVTGLVLVDTYTHWSLFGQAVILTLIQIGGLGFMTMTTFFSIAVRRKITFKERLIMSNALSVDNMSGIVRLTKRILYGTLIFEGIGAIILATRFYEEFGFLGAVRRGVFHSISAFCNAGFDILGHNEPFTSLMNYSTDIVVNIVIMTLIIIGGLGFFVWGDIYNGERLSTHTKIVIITTATLIVGGTILFYIFEKDNAQTIGNMSLFNKWLCSAFQSVTTRTAGFNTISQADLTNPSMILTYLLMFIGGSTGSTAGGVKTVTIAILLIASVNTIRGKTKHIFAGRSININSIISAMSIVVSANTVIFSGILIISAIENIKLEYIIYEVISAFATVGLSTGITGQLSSVSHIILMMIMFLGRLGILTLGFALLKGKKESTQIDYPQGTILIG